METLWQTSAMRLAVRSRVSLWRIDGKPPNGQERACLSVIDHHQILGMDREQTQSGTLTFLQRVW